MGNFIGERQYQVYVPAVRKRHRHLHHPEGNQLVPEIPMYQQVAGHYRGQCSIGYPDPPLKRGNMGYHARCERVARDPGDWLTIGKHGIPPVPKSFVILQRFTGPVTMLPQKLENVVAYRCGIGASDDETTLCSHQGRRSL